MERGEGSNQFPGGEEVNREKDQTNACEDAVSAAQMVGTPVTLVIASNDATVGSGTVKRGPGRPKGSKKSDGFINPYQFSQKEISEANQETGNGELVNSLLMRFDAVRRRLSQVKIVGGEATVAIRNFKNRQLYTNRKKRVGSVPGIGVGDIFFLWGEMELVGLHGVPIGTDFMRVEENGENKLLAVSIVSSGTNADKGEDPDVLIFTGFGSGQEADQKLVTMNLSLKTALEERSDVRVIRAVEDERRMNGKIYIYDGIYSIANMWEENSSNGFKIYKFRLVRKPDQKPAFAKWRAVEQWKKGLITRPGLVLEDLSCGAENLKVSLVNEVDEEKVPAPFRYVTSLKQPIINISPMVDVCTCPPRACASGDGSCLCVDRNGDQSPYIDKVLVTRRSLIYECGGSCHCAAECKNKVIQTGLKFKLEVFKTISCGWGLRSWDPIRAGSFICEYAGDLMQYGNEDEDHYIFNPSRVYKSFQWNYEPYLVGEDDKEKVPENINRSPSPTICAKKSGNVARFMNHSCSPNVLWQPIAREENGIWCICIGLFAMKHIPPLTELKYDYGTSRGYGRWNCLCGSDKCSGSFG